MQLSSLQRSALLLAFLCGALTPAGGLSFSYPTFRDNIDEKDFIKSKYSRIYYSAIQITPDLSDPASIVNQSGRFLYKKPFKLWGKGKGGVRSRSLFNSTFVLKITPQTDPGGEGLAFILTGSPTLPEKSQGEWLGIVNANSNGSAQANIVAVEFDTRKSYLEYVDDNHVGLDVNSVYSIQQVPLLSYGVTLSSQMNYTVTIRYDSQNITIFVFQTNETREEMKNIPVLSRTLDLSEYLSQEVYVGFSASTSNSTQLNCIRSWDFHSSDIDENSNLLWVWIMVPAVVVLVTGVSAYLFWTRQDFIARLGDFGLARTIQQSGLTHHSTKEIAGTPGYMAPETFLTGRATVETDVYAFGVLVLEVVCGRRPSNQNEQNNYNNSIVYWLWDLYSRGRILDAVDSRLDGDIDEDDMARVLVLGLSCCHPNPHLRPSMRTVLKVLTREADPPALPTERPAFVWPAMPPSFKEDTEFDLAGGQIPPFTELTGR
ncbi:hypothetical protein GBA52_024080 [Prunus armeniaca]|nr:hypothetical protein GBA52_024080 [Prunus armeniaca]